MWTGRVFTLMYLQEQDACLGYSTLQPSTRGQDLRRRQWQLCGLIFGLSCVEPGGVGLDDPHKPLPIWDILWFYNLVIQRFLQKMCTFHFGLSMFKGVSPCISQAPAIIPACFQAWCHAFSPGQPCSIKAPPGQGAEHPELHKGEKSHRSELTHCRTSARTLVPLAPLSY